MKNISRVESKIDNLNIYEIQDIVQEKSKYDMYIFEFEGQVQKDYYRHFLSKYKLYLNDHTTSNNNGLFFYSPRPIKKKNSGDFLPGYAIYSAEADFVSSGKFESSYYTDDVNLNIIKNSEFKDWLEKYLIDIFRIDPSKLYQPRKFVYENMKKIKKFNDFLNEKKIPKLTIGIEELLSVLDNKVDIFRIFKINKDEVGVRDNIDKLYSNGGFNKNIKKNKLKKGKLQNTMYSETLLDDKYILKFFFLHNEDSIELEEPEFIILQYYNKDKDESSDILGFDNRNNIDEFYEKLTDATIELTKGDDTYVYQTSNGGNNWEMKNVQMEDDEMKGTFDKKELQKIIDKKNLKMKNA